MDEHIDNKVENEVKLPKRRSIYSDFKKLLLVAGLSGMGYVAVQYYISPSAELKEYQTIQNDIGVMTELSNSYSGLEDAISNAKEKLPVMDQELREDEAQYEKRQTYFKKGIAGLATIFGFACIGAYAWTFRKIKRASKIESKRKLGE